MIELKGICKTYKAQNGLKTLALDNVTFSLPNKGLFFILGKSGSGKSTLLNILGGLDQYDSGDVIIEGKSTKAFQEKDYDYYRNTYIGFIFQEFNLLEEYNVCDNINLSRKLQKEKVSQTVVDNLLNKVGIVGLGKRRMNELSGGQKQRVAIARALIKNPEIILADEPTGNLDVETGKQIFTLLKSISKEKLVIVVSHDRESALAYADGIIELADGKIIFNTIQLSSEECRTFKLKKSKLPFLDCLKLSLLNLNSHKVKLFFTILLVFMSVVFFGVSRLISSFNIEKSQAKTMVHNKIEYVNLYKNLYDVDNNLWAIHGQIYPDDINQLSDVINSDYIYRYHLIEENQPINFDINYQSQTSAPFAYYATGKPFLNFIEADSNFINQKIIGEYPKAYDEIMIHSYFADYIMHYGIMLYNDNIDSTEAEYYMPTNYEDFLTSDKYFKFGSSKLKVSGIILDDTERFNHLKTMEPQMIGQERLWFGIPIDENKSYEFKKTVLAFASDIYVAEGFIKNLQLKPNTSVNTSHYSNEILFQGKHYSVNSAYCYPDKKINMFDGEKFTSIEKLNANEIIVSEKFLNQISNEEYMKLKEQYVEKRSQSGKKYTYMKKEEIELEFLKNYLKENKIIGSNISLSFKSFFENKNELILNDLTIIGIELGENRIYIANGIADEVIENNYFIYNVLIKESNQKELEKLFSLYPFENAPYTTSTIYSEDINIISNSLKSIVPAAKYASYIFGFFALLLLTNFIVNSIYDNKRAIGILRGLGARKMDIFKICLSEGIIIGSFSLILSIITLYIVINFTNDYISSHLFFNINFIIFTPENLLLIIGSTFGIIFISSLFTVRKIAKMNPVDAISNK